MTGPSDGMFDPFTDDELREAERSAPADKSEAPQAIVPAPADAPELDWSRLRPPEAKGAPVGTWTYLTADGGVAFHVARWENEDPHGRKVIRPATWNGTRWVLKAMPKPRPLFDLPTVLEGPTKSVVVAEGERCVDAAARVFPDHSATTWAGGSSAWELTDWGTLAGRDVLLLADADDPGREAMRRIAERLASMGCTVRIHLPTGDDGRDIADWLSSDGPEKTRDRIEAEAERWESAVVTAADASATETDDEAIARLAALPELEYERVRTDEAERLGVRVTQLDKLVRNERSSGEDDHLQGRRIEWNEPEPWPEPVDGEVLLTDIAELIRRYVDMPDEKAVAVALWIAHTFLHSRLDLSTILNVTSATKRCGKSLLMEVAGTLVSRSLTVSGRITPAGMFRIIALHQPTLILDEADTFMSDDPELRGIVNGSQRREMAFVIRAVGEDHEPRLFRSWCPKAISGIGDLPDTVADRAVTVRLERRSPTSGDMPHWRDRDRQAVEVLKRKLARWTDDSADAVLERRNGIAFPSALQDRARDAWEALLAIGEVAGGEWAGATGRTYRACEAVNAEVDSETGIREMLLADIRKLFEEAGDAAQLPTGKSNERYDPCSPAILPAPVAMEGRPWAEYSRGSSLTARGLASLLKGFGIAPGTIRLNHKLTAKGYKRESFEPTWKRYGIPAPEEPRKPSVTASQPRLSAVLGDCASVTSPESMTDGNQPNPTVGAGCDAVTDGNPTAIYENADNRDPNPLDDMVADADERAAILEFEGEVPRVDAERMTESQCGLKPGTLVNMGTQP